ncbi:MAG: tRNA (adenosine(37)-N6)-threonylcarbamoyltransferase complex ATPase subunit type 1 TsaE [Myxococcota bacterium]
MTVADESALRAVAGRLACLLQPPCLVALRGELGTGKTAFTRGFVEALDGGSKACVSSPTYALANTYPTRPVVHHVDLSRLDPATDLWDLGLAELMVDEAALVCVEWPGDCIRRIRAARWVRVDLGMDASRRPCFRTVHFTFGPTWGPRPFAGLRAG